MADKLNASSTEDEMKRCVIGYVYVLIKFFDLPGAPGTVQIVSASKNFKHVISTLEPWFFEKMDSMGPGSFDQYRHHEIWAFHAASGKFYKRFRIDEIPRGPIEFKAPYQIIAD